MATCKELTGQRWSKVEYKAKTRRSTPDLIQVLNRDNITRLYCEIKDMEFLIACGEHAHLAVKVCQEFLGFKGKVCFVKHTSSQALGCPTADQRDARIREWCDCVLEGF